MDPKRPPAQTLTDLVRWAATRFADRECLRFDGRSLTFDAVERRSAQLANVLHDQGIGPDQRVAILLPNGLDWPVAWLAVLRAGAGAVPVNVRCRDADLRHVLSDSRARTVVTDAAHAQPVRDTDTSCLVLDEIGDELERANPDDPGVTVQPGDLANPCVSG